MREQEKHKKAFEAYYAMGEARSLARLAKRFGVAKNTMKNWSAEFQWAERVAQRDREVARVVQSKTIQEQVDAGVRNKQIVQLALVTLARQIAEGKVRGTMADLDRLVRLESFLEGKADSRQEVIARDLQGKSMAELRIMLRAEVDSLAELTEFTEAEEVGESVDQAGPALGQGGEG